MSELGCDIALPPDFRSREILAFHARDPQAISERVAADTLDKGLFWEGHPACLSIAFTQGNARIRLAADGKAADAAALERMARRMLGLTQNIAACETALRDHPLLGPVMAKRPGLRVPVAATPFEALTWAITGQQISVGAAVSIRRKLILAAGERHSSGLWCYPDAARVARLDETGLRALGFSQGKARTLLALSAAVLSGEAPLDDWAMTPDGETIRAALVGIRGIGPWTASYALLRGYGFLDGSLHGDVAVRRNLQILLGRETKLGEAEAEAWLAQFTPWRALVAAHLWAMQTDDGY